MSLLAYIWQTIMRKTHFGGTFFRFFTFVTAIHKRNMGKTVFNNKGNVK